jgi:hypothetical protein
VLGIIQGGGQVAHNTGDRCLGFPPDEDRGGGLETAVHAAAGNDSEQSVVGDRGHHKPNLIQMGLQEEMRFALLWGADGADNIMKMVCPDGLFGERGAELGNPFADCCFLAGHAADLGENID